MILLKSLSTLCLTEIRRVVSKRQELRVGSVSSAGEHHVDIVGVTGSIPVRSTNVMLRRLILTNYEFCIIKYFVTRLVCESLINTLMPKDLINIRWRVIK